MSGNDVMNCTVKKSKKKVIKSGSQTQYNCATAMVLIKPQRN